MRAAPRSVIFRAMRSPRPAVRSCPLPQLAGPVLLGALLAAGGDASAQPADAGATDDASSADAAMPPVVVAQSHTGGVPMRTGGAPPRHGACACDVPRATGGERYAAVVAATLAALAARRRRAR